MSDLINALANWNEYDPPTERFESTGQLIRESHAEILRLRFALRQALARQQKENPPCSDG